MSILPLVAKSASIHRRGKTLVGPIDLEIRGKGITIVIGPNGSGKTSLLRMLHGLERLSAGSVSWSCPIETARQKQAFVFQAPIMMRRTLRENLLFPLKLRNTPRAEADKLVDEWADRVGLSSALSRRATVLSGGEKQKLALARALICAPEVLFLDEPCASLDGRATREIEDVLKRAAESGTRLIMSTHDMGQARRLADEVVFLLDGKVHETGPASAIFSGAQSTQTAAFLRGDIVE